MLERRESTTRMLVTSRDPRVYGRHYDPRFPFACLFVDEDGDSVLLFPGGNNDHDWRPTTADTTGGGGGTGPQGPQGPQGLPGLDGLTGARGPAGTQGIQGVPGPAGATGPAGADGADGTDGADGAIGLTGAAGPAGPTGATGAAGAAGATGATGAAGAVGAAGPTGAAGADGAPGAAGATGPAGPAPSGTGFVHVTGGVLDTPHEITGDVAVGASGVATIQASAVSTSKLGGDVTAAGKALLDDADASAQRTTLGLGVFATSTDAANLTGNIAAARIIDGSLSLAKIANIATARFLGRNTAGAGALEELSAATAKAMLAIVPGDVSGLAAIASSGSASDLGTGTLPIARIADGTVTLAKHANMTTARLLGRNTAGAGVPEELSAATAKTLLAIAAGDVSGLAAVATSGSASDLGTGTLPIARIAAGAVTYAKVQDVSATDRLLGRSTAGAGSVEEVTCTAAGRALIDDADAAAQRTTLGLGTAATQASTAFEASGNVATHAALVSGVHGISVYGATLIDDANAAAARTTLGLAAIAASASASDLTAGTVPAAQMPALTGDVTTVAGAVATTIGAGKVSLAMLANMATSRIRGRITAGSGVPEELTGTQVTTLLDVRTETLKGLMPANYGIRAALGTNKSIANTLTQVVGFTAAANTLAANTVVNFRGLGLLTNTTSASTSVLTLRINSASLGVTIEASWSLALGIVARTNSPFIVEGDIVIISTGAGGTAWGVIVVGLDSATALGTPTSMVTAAVTCITTQSNVVELTCISGAASTTWNFISATAKYLNP